MKKWLLILLMSITAVCWVLAAEPTPINEALRNAKNAEPSFSNTVAQAQAGDANAQIALGNVFAEGLYSVPQNDAEALQWYERSARAGNSLGEFILASFYEQGRGTTRNEAQALAWYKLSAGQGFTRAQAALGRIYASGQGVAKDPIEAYKWLSLAAAGGDNSANEERLKLAETMSLQQVAEGEYRTGSFRPVVGDAAGRKSQDDSPTPKSIEAGFFITPDGYFLSKMHVTRDAKKIMLKNKSGLMPARFVKGSIASDLAIYKVEGAFSALPISISSSPGRGSAVLVPTFNNDDWKSAQITQQNGSVLGLVTNAPDAFQVRFARPAENAGGCVVDTMGSAIGLAAFETFKPDQANAILTATSLGSLKQLLSTLPLVRSALVPVGKQERKENAIAEASALLLSY